MVARDAPVSRGTRDQRGVALILALFALMVVTSIGLAMMYSADTETSVNSNYRDEQAAYFGAKAGLEEARDRMQTTAGATISASLPSALPGAVGGVLYLLNPAGSETVAPWSTTNQYLDDEICKEVNCSGGQVPPTSGWYTSVLSSATYAGSPVLPYKWMRITVKTDASAYGSAKVMYVDGNSSHASYYVCWNGANEFAQSAACASANRVYVLTTLAVTPSGTRRMLQYELTRDTLNVTLPSALTLDGTSDSMSGPNSNPFHMDGTDHAGCGGVASQPARPAIGVPDTPDIATVKGGIPSNRQSNYTGSGAAPDVENVSSTMPSNLQTISSMNYLLTTIKNNANQVLNGNQSSLSNPGTAATPQIIYVNGDLSLSGNVTGYGLLVVTGTFSPVGNVGWNGLVFVVGKGVVTGNGGGNNSYNGAIVVAKTVDSVGNPLSSFGAATFSFSGGGGNGIYYSSGCVAQAPSLSDYRIISTREMMY